MVRRYYDLPSLTALAAFEASARHKSFKLAAAELNVTPGAVSRQIKSLEEELATPLFQRRPQGVELTNDAEDLYAVISNGFGRASEVVQRIKSGSHMNKVTLACTNAMATMWLMPRMGDFWRRYPKVMADHLILDNTRDFRRAEVDLRIRYGTGAWPDETAVKLFDECIYPVCGPAFAEAHKDCLPSIIPTLPLLHIDWLDPNWVDWDEMLRRAGIAHGPLPGRRFSSFAVTLQACQENQGIAIGWDRLIRQYLKTGALVRLTDLHMPAPGSYYLTWNDNREPTPASETLRDWLLEMAERDLAADANTA
ncbi:MAG: LysR substrate-binding domain-containing protein [Alphaproteobacteria bacterium]